MSQAIRQRILEILKAHDQTGSAVIYSDERLVNDLAIGVKEVQDQLDILEEEGLVEVYRAFGPSYAATITPMGKLHLEDD